MDGELEEFKIIGQALVALLLGGLVGWEREAAGKWAGIRTHMLLCAAVFLFVKTGDFLVGNAETRYPNELLQSDPLRILEAIVTGLSFIGAGTIFRNRQKQVAEGLTTAASMLMVAPIGVAIAVDRYIVAGGVTLLTLFVLRTVAWFERKAGHRRPSEKTPTQPGQD